MKKYKGSTDGFKSGLLVHIEKKLKVKSFFEERNKYKELPHGFKSGLL